MKAHTLPRKSISAVQIAGVFIGTVVGAGFASGQETLRFFSLHGLQGMWGVALSAVLFAVYGGMVLQIGRRLQARSHLELVRAVAGTRLGGVIDLIITVSLLGALTVMAAGSGAALAAQFGWTTIAGSALMLLATVTTVLWGIRGVVTAISWVAPFLIGGTVLLSLLVTRTYVVNNTWAASAQAAGRWWPMSAVAYVSYNMLLALAVLAPMGTLGDQVHLRRGAVLGGIGLGLTAMALHMAILTQVPQAAAAELPMLYVVGKVLVKAPLFYTMLLIAEIYTTAVANLYGFAARIAVPGSVPFYCTVVAAAALALLGGQVGFAKLVSVLYLAMGYAGLIVLLALTWHCCFRSTDCSRRGI